MLVSSGGCEEASDASMMTTNTGLRESTWLYPWTGGHACCASTTLAHTAVTQVYSPPHAGQAHLLVPLLLQVVT